MGNLLKRLLADSSGSSEMTSTYTCIDRVEIKEDTILNAGDKLAIQRDGRPYRHIVIADGQGNAIHKTGDFKDGVKGILQDGRIHAEIRKDKLENITGPDCIAYKHNDKDAAFGKHRKDHRAVKYAEDRIGPCTYNPNTDNCEHFANEVRYDRKEADQNLMTAACNIAKRIR